MEPCHGASTMSEVNSEDIPDLGAGLQLFRWADFLLGINRGENELPLHISLSLTEMLHRSCKSKNLLFSLPAAPFAISPTS